MEPMMMAPVHVLAMKDGPEPLVTSAVIQYVDIALRMISISVYPAMEIR